MGRYRLHDSIFGQPIELKARQKLNWRNLDQLTRSPSGAAPAQPIALCALICDEFFRLSFSQQS